MLRTLLFAGVTSIALATAPALAVTITPTDYDYLGGTPPSAIYPDSGGKLTDGATGGAWNVDPTPWVGFHERDAGGPITPDGDDVGPTIRFFFGAAVTIDSLSL